MGSVDGGLLGMAWSPDQELVVFSTRTGTLLLMTHQLDLSGDAGGHELVPVTETPISPTDIGEGTGAHCWLRVCNFTFLCSQASDSWVGPEVDPISWLCWEAIGQRDASL